MSKKLRSTKTVLTTRMYPIRREGTRIKGSEVLKICAPSVPESELEPTLRDSEGYSPKAYNVSFHGLRATLDGLEVSCPIVRPSPAVWATLERVVDAGEALVVKLTNSKGKPRGTLSFQGRRLGVAALRFKDDRLGICVDVRRPLPSNHSAKRQSAGVVVTMSGRGFSTRRQGVSHARLVLRGLEGLLFPERGSTAKKRWKKMGPHRFARDVHLAVDVAVRGQDASPWIRDELFRGNNPQGAREAWVTRSKASSKATEPDHSYREFDHDLKNGSSFRLQGTCVRFTVYEKDREPKSWPNVEKVLTRCGFQPGDRVIRIEWKLGGEWLRQQKIGGRPFSQLTLDEFFEALPDLAKMLGERYRHAVPSSGMKARWKTSEFGTAVQVALASLEVRGKGALKATAVQAASLQQVIRGATVRLLRELHRLRALGGVDGSPLSVEEVKKRVAQMLGDEASSGSDEKWMNRERRRFGLLPMSPAMMPTPEASTTVFDSSYDIDEE